MKNFCSENNYWDIAELFSVSLNISLDGDNKLTITNPNGLNKAIYGIYNDFNRVVCNGEGSLDISVGANADGCYGIHAIYGVTINNGSINIETGASSANYSTALNAFNSGGDGIVINGGSLNATSQAGKWETNVFEGNVTNSISGRGWINSDGSGDFKLIETSTSKRELTYGKVEFPYTPHSHIFTYSSDDGATITATCTADGCTLDDGQGNHTATLTIGAPTLTTYGQTGDGISAETTFIDANSIKGDATVSYFATDSDGNKTGTALTAAPTNAGTYWAEITLGTDNDSATAHVVYTIAKASVETPTKDEIGFTIVSYTNETFTVNEGYEASSTNADSGLLTTNSLTAILDSGNSPKIYIRKAATDNTNASDWLEISFTGRRDAPSGLEAKNAKYSMETISDDNIKALLRN